MGWIPGWDSVAAASWWSGFYFWLSILALIGLGAFEVASHRYSDRKDELAATEQEATQRGHDEEMARLHLETAKAQGETEKLRQQNLELEKAVAPRLLNEGPPVQALKPFATQIVQLDTILEYDAERLAGGLASLFKSAGWDLRPANPKLQHAFEGVTIEYFQRAGTEDPDPNQAQRVAAARALQDELKKQNIEATLRPMPGNPATQETLQGAGMIIESIMVTVGPKPTTYFLEQRYPWIKEQREHFEKMQADSDRKRADMRERINKSLIERGLPPIPDEP